MFGDLTKMMSQLSEAKKNIEAAKEKLEDTFIEGSAGNGLVTVTVNGNKMVKNLFINDLLLTDKDALEDYLILALNDALQKANNLSEKEMANAAKKGMPFNL